MNRKRFLGDSLKLGLGCCAVLGFGSDAASGAEAETPASPPPGASEAGARRVQGEKTFTDNWLVDLLATIQAECDPALQIKLMEGCGRGCFRRHKFKRDIAAAAAAAEGTREGLLEAYRRRWDAWFEGDDFHIRVRYDTAPPVCRCPVLHGHPAGQGELHCHCTKATHAALLEAALGRKVAVEIVETVRRGAASCHFVARLPAG